MPPKPRKPEHQTLVSNLYCRKGYYSWRDPRTGREFGIGRNKADAIDQAIEANREILNAGSLIERVNTAPRGRTLAGFVPRYLDAIKARKLAPTTLTHRKLVIATIEAALGDMPIAARQEDATEITRRVADWLRADYTSAGKLRMAKFVRSVVSDLFAEMAAAGWIAVNPIAVIRLEAPEVHRQRLTLDDFWKIYTVAGTLDPWVQNSMAAAVVTLQRREDIAAMQFKHEVNGRLEVVQHKSQGRTRLRIPLTLRLDAVNWTVGDIITRCRDNVVARHLMHHTINQGKAKAGQRVHPQTITGAFTECRDRAGIVIEPGKTPPTYHELRSLGARLYEQQGYAPQSLLGHRDARTTAVYVDNRGAEWIDVAA